MTEPVKGRNTVLGSHDFVRENAGRGTEGMPGGEQKVVVFMSRVGWRLLEGAGEHDGAASPLGLLNQVEQAMTKPGNGREGIENEQANVQVKEGAF